jgi:hypothetical protein
MLLLFLFVSVIADFRRIRSSFDQAELSEKVLSRLSRYNVTSLQSIFSFLPARNWAMNQFADMIMSLANNFQHLDPCNFAGASAKLQSVCKAFNFDLQLSHLSFGLRRIYFFFPCQN